MKIRILTIIKETGSDGPGLRNSVYMAGCSHHCPGCHNPQSWDPEGGTEREVSDIVKELLSVPYNITISGGDPFYQADALYELLSEIKRKDPQRNIWVFTGHTYEQLIKKGYLDWLEKIDVLVDGPFVLAQRDVSRFCGSKNQRILHLCNGKIVKEE